MATDFELFVDEVRPTLTRAFLAAYGTERGQEALAEAMAYAWENFQALREMTNPAGYLFRVGQSRTRFRRVGRVASLPEVQPGGSDYVDPRLPSALRSLSPKQRLCIGLIHGYDWTYQEVADLLGVTKATVQEHTDRGMAKMRRRLLPRGGGDH